MTTGSQQALSDTLYPVERDPDCRRQASWAGPDGAIAVVRAYIGSVRVQQRQRGAVCKKDIKISTHERGPVNILILIVSSC